MNYFKINLSTINAGLSHQTNNLRSIIYYCYTNNLKLIKPIFLLTGNHNNKKQLTTDLSKYYDLNNITINGKLFKLYDDDVKYTYTVGKKSYHAGLLANDPMFLDFKKVKNINMVIPYKQDIIDIAKKVYNELDEYMCIHVRRGDRIKNKQNDIDTQPDNIRKIIEKYKPKKVYIMTNKINELKSLSNVENIYFYTNFDFLDKITDNYYLFSIENEIMNFAKIRCSTYNVPLMNKNKSINYNSDYYDCYLTNFPGFQ